MEQNPGRDSYQKTLETYGVTEQKFRDTILKLESGITLSRADLIHLMSDGKADIMEAQRINQEVDGFVKKMVAEGYLTETNTEKRVAGMLVKDPSISYVRTAKEVREAA